MIEVTYTLPKINSNVYYRAKHIIYKMIFDITIYVALG